MSRTALHFQYMPEFSKMSLLHDLTGAQSMSHGGHGVAVPVPVPVPVPGLPTVMEKADGYITT